MKDRSNLTESDFNFDRNAHHIRNDRGVLLGWTQQQDAYGTIFLFSATGTLLGRYDAEMDQTNTLQRYYGKGNQLGMVLGEHISNGGR